MTQKLWKGATQPICSNTLTTKKIQKASTNKQFVLTSHSQSSCCWLEDQSWMFHDLHRIYTSCRSSCDLGCSGCSCRCSNTLLWPREWLHWAESWLVIRSMKTRVYWAKKKKREMASYSVRKFLHRICYFHEHSISGKVDNFRGKRHASLSTNNLLLQTKNDRHDIM